MTLKKSLIFTVLFLVVLTSIVSSKEMGVTQNPIYLEKRHNGTTQASKPCKKHAMLINGGEGVSDSRFCYQLSSIYEELIRLNFEVTIFHSKGQNSNYYPVDKSADKSELKSFIEDYKKRVKPQDMLFVYTTNHGQLIKEADQFISTLELPGEDLTQKEFWSYFKNIESQINIFVFDQCFSGGFVKEVTGDNFIAFGSAQPNEEARSDIDDSFGLHFINALHYPSKADINADGRISLFEQNMYAINTHKGIKHKLHTPIWQGSLNPKEVFMANTTSSL